jgi:hypothetical protein
MGFLMPNALSLTAARKAGSIDKFIAQREAEAAPDGDEKALNRTLAAMAESKKAVPATSKPDRSAD